MSKGLVIWGCGGHAREVNLLCEHLGQEVVGFLDEREEMKGKIVDDIPVLGDIRDILSLRGKVEVLCAGVGDPGLKKRFYEKTVQADFDLAKPLVHPSVRVSKRVTLEQGCVICEGSILTINIKIGHSVIINRMTNIGHDCEIGNFVTVSPGCNISGNVLIEEGAYIGTGSSLREKIKIGSWSVIGGGAFVKDNVPQGVLFAGVPAIHKKNLY